MLKELIEPRNKLYIYKNLVKITKGNDWKSGGWDYSSIVQYLSGLYKTQHS